MLVETGLKRINPKKGKQLVLEMSVNGCIICTSHAPNKDGYIRIYVDKVSAPRMQMLHRLTWKSAGQQIPDGYELDHKCRNRACCNPEHLQLLTIRDHKIKTNKERYLERTELIEMNIRNGIKNSLIAASHGVGIHTVRRIQKLMKEKYED